MNTRLMNLKHSRKPSRAFWARRSAKSRGAVMVLALLGGLILVGMIGYVFNTGRHAQLRQQTQSAADATGISGAGYMARSFNTVAMNNVEISRLIAAVQLLDAVPQAAQYSFEDTDALLTRLDEQISVGTGDRVFDEKLEDVADEIREQHRKLDELDAFFNRGGYDVAEVTFYDHGGNRGEMWQAMESLDAISSATMQTVGELGQVTAIHAGRRNLSGSGGERFAAIAPFESPYPWHRNHFDDFKEPVIVGSLPRAVDDVVTNRGPYDTIFGWRDDVRGPGRRELVGYRPPTQQTTTTSAGGSSPWSGGGGNSGGPNGGPIYRWIPGEVIGYHTFGPWRWLNREFRRQVPQILREFPSQSCFGWYVQRIAEHKLLYLWNDAVQVGTISQPPRNIRLVNQPQPIFDPEWITDYGRARTLVNAADPRIRFTQWVQMEFRMPIDDNGRPIGPEEMVGWGILRAGAITEPPDQGGRLRKIRSHVWEDQGEQTTTTEFLDANGQVISTTVEHFRLRWMYVWAGLDIGEEVDVRNPNNFTDRSQLPAPIDFDHGAMARPVDGAVGLPGNAFTVLGLAKQSNAAPMWRGLFDTSAYQGHVGIAQASVFNNHSWDLWTQMWHAQLEPVQEYSGWIDLIEGQIDSALGYEDLSAEALRDLAQYLRSLESVAPVMLNH